VRGEARNILGLAIASQASLSIVQWGIGALGPDLESHYGMSAAALGALLQAAAVGNALALILAGGLVDQQGVRVPMIVGGIGAGATLALGALAPSAWVLGGALVVFGVFGSFVAVAGSVAVFHAFGAARRGLAMGVRQMSISLGGLLAAVLLPGLSYLGGIRLAFTICGILTAISAVAFGLASARGLAHGAARPPFEPVAVLRIPGMPRLMLVGMLLITTLTTVLTFGVTALVDDGASRVAGAALVAVISLAAVTARLFWGRLADGAGGTRRRRTLCEVAVVACAGALLYWAATRVGPGLELPVMAFFAFGALGFNGVFYVIAGELAGPGRAGQAVGLGSTVLFGGSALAAVPLGALADVAGYQALWPVAAACAALGLLVARGLPDGAPPAPA
jgi:MFS family permease